MTPPEAACGRLPPRGGGASGPAKPDPRPLLGVRRLVLRGRELAGSASGECLFG